MFESRIKYFLLFLLVVTGLLGLRAAYIQLFGGQDWQRRASMMMQKTLYSETTRGTIVDLRGRPLAVDEACVDACVDYRVIPREPDEKWVRDFARERIIRKIGEIYTKAPLAQKKEMLKEEVQKVLVDIENLWPTLARVRLRATDGPEMFQQRLDQVLDVRQSIEMKVEMQRRWIWYRNYERAMTERGQQASNASSIKRFLLGDSSDLPKIDSFDNEVGEQTASHAVLRAIDSSTEQYLGKNLEQLPGLSLKPGAHRVYPYRDIGAHFIGSLSRVDREDLENDPNAGKDILRTYRPNDQIGRAGIEKLCEQDLRGSRGEMVLDRNDNEIANTLPQPGKTVTCSIDIDLQREVQKLLELAPFKDPKTDLITRVPTHGAAVVIDVPTGEVRVLASNPSFDVNTLDIEYEKLSRDDWNQPLLNRATQAVREPGSTVKPLVGLGAMAMGALAPEDRIECTGFMMLNGKRQSRGRCWVASNFLGRLGVLGVSHHPIPEDMPSPTGFLDYPEALERSCNVFFETVAGKMGYEGIAYWQTQFGLGRKTGIGIAESAGRTMATYRGPRRLMDLWISGIGQGQVGATPLQMANVAATIARGGIWMQPTLVHSPAPFVQERIDLKLPRKALEMCKEGMVRVVQSPAGSAHKTKIYRPDIVIAAKSGSAQAAKFSVPRRDAAGNLVKDENGHVIRDLVIPSKKDNINPLAPWYMAHGENGTEFTHSWFIGFAPADNPQIAFAVLIEYGGGGGAIAGPFAGEMLEDCVIHGYLSRNSR